MTHPTAQIEPEKIHLNEVRLLQSHFGTSDQFLTNPVIPNRTNVQIGQNSGIDLKTNAYGVKLDIILSALDEKGQEIGLNARYTIHFGFIVDNLADFVKVEGTNTDIDIRLGATVIGIAYSTARGIVLERTQGSFFNGAILPVLNPANILTGPAAPAPPISSSSPELK